MRIFVTLRSRCVLRLFYRFLKVCQHNLTRDVTTVLDASQDVAGSFCAKILAELGMEVIKVEPPEGDPLRRVGPFKSGVPHLETSAPFLYLNTSKKSVTLDLHSHQGRELLDQLIARSDVLVHSFPTHDSAAMELGYDRLSRLQPSLVMTSLSPFGRSGPYADYKAVDLTLYALSGHMYLTGQQDREPLMPYGNQPQHQLGLNACVATLAALFFRERTGIAQEVDVTGMETGASILENSIGLYTFRNIIRSRYGNRYFRGSPIINYYQCSDGWVGIFPVGRSLEEFSLLIEHPELTSMLETGQDVEAIFERFYALAVNWCLAHSREEIFQRAQELRIPCGIGYTIPELLNDPQLVSRRHFVKLDHPQAGSHHYPSLPIKGKQLKLTDARAPRLGEHQEEIFGQAQGRIGNDRADEIAGAKGAVEKLPLHNVRVVDLTRAWAGPYATSLLADMGAEVIKIESKVYADIFRAQSSELDLSSSHPEETSPWFHTINRNKLSLSLNLSDPQGKQTFRELVAISDIVVENFSTRVMPNLGLGYEQLREVSPDLVMVSMPAFGNSGPYKDFVGYGEPMELMGGLAMLTGYEGESTPIRMGVAYSDCLASYHAVIAVLWGLLQRNLTGRGQYFDISHFEAVARTIGDAVIAYGMNGEQPTFRGNKSRWMVPHGCYPCADEDKWVTIAVQSDTEWRALCRSMGRPGLAEDPRFTTLIARKDHEKELDEYITQWTRTMKHTETMHQLQQAGVTAGAVLSADELVRDPQLAYRGFFQVEDHPVTGKHLIPGTSFKFSRSQARIKMPTPLFAQHSVHLLQGLLGKLATETARLKTDKIAGFEFDSR